MITFGDIFIESLKKECHYEGSPRVGGGGRLQRGFREFQGGFREFQRVFREYSGRAECVRHVVTNCSLLSLCFLSVFSLSSPCSSLFSPCLLSAFSLSSPCFLPYAGRFLPTRITVGLWCAGAGIQKYTHNIILPHPYNVGIIFNTRIGEGARREREGEIATATPRNDKVV